MKTAAILLLSLGLAAAQLSKEDQSFIDSLAGGGTGGPVDPAIATEEYTRCEGDKFCVPYYLCEDNNIVTDGAGLIDIRFGGASGATEEHIQHSECGDQYTNVCCTDPQDRTNEPLTEPYLPSCGRRNPLGIHARIVGIDQNESQFGEFPWMAAVLRTDGDKLVFVCGASLIDQKVLVTAAHCVYGQQGLVVRLGEWDTQHTTEFYPHLDADVAQVVIHENYNHARGNLHNDIALLILAEPVPLQEHIDTICLPDPASPPVYGADCIATGWGKDSFESGQFQLVLKQVNLPLVERQECQNYLQQTRLGLRFRLHEGFTCAGGTGADTCTGDGGSPLACPDPNSPDRYVLRGIVSWGIGCGTINVPGVYVDVTYYSNWVFSQLQAYQKR